MVIKLRCLLPNYSIYFVSLALQKYLFSHCLESKLIGYFSAFIFNAKLVLIVSKAKLISHNSLGSGIIYLFNWK